MAVLVSPASPSLSLHEDSPSAAPHVDSIFYSMQDPGHTGAMKSTSNRQSQAVESSPHLGHVPEPHSTELGCSPDRTSWHFRAATLAGIRDSNVRLIIAHIFLFTIYQSICQWNLFDAYLSLLAKQKGYSNGNTWVGFAEGISGVATLLLAFPLGVLADTFDRIRLLHVAAYIGLIATAVTMYAFARDNVTTLYTNLIMWGIFQGLQCTAAEALFADSTEPGERSKKFTFKSVANTCGLSLGPLLMLGLFSSIGNHWQVQMLHLPLLTGCIFAPLACLPFFFIKDPQPKIDASLASLMEAAPPSLRSPLLGHTEMGPRQSSSSKLESDHVGLTLYDHSEPSPEPTAILPPCALEAETNEKHFASMTRRERFIPYLLTASDFVMDVGAGMTVRFFPLFFIHDYGVSPTMLCALYCAYPLLISVSMSLCQKVSGRLGRSQCSFLCQMCGCFTLWCMARIQSLPLLIAAFLLRGQLQNAAFPIDRSILMDYIPSEHRGKWSAVSALCTMTWSGSAVLGGYLADSHDYRYTFTITASVYAVGILLYSPLLFLVPRSETRRSEPVPTPRRCTPSDEKSACIERTSKGNNIKQSSLTCSITSAGTMQTDDPEC